MRTFGPWLLLGGAAAPGEALGWGGGVEGDTKPQAKPALFSQSQKDSTGK